MADQSGSPGVIAARMNLSKLLRVEGMGGEMQGLLKNNCSWKCAPILGGRNSTSKRTI